MVKIKFLYKAQVINILIALLISIFVIFPKLIDFIDKDDHPDSPKHNSIEAPTPKKPISNHLEPTPESKAKHLPPSHKRPPPGNPGSRSFKSLPYEFTFFFFLAWGGILIFNPIQKRKSKLIKIPERIRPAIRILIAFVICNLGTLVYSHIQPGKFSHFNPFPWYKDGVMIFKGLFTFLSVVLFGNVLRLLYKQQAMLLENEELKTESLQNKFEALSSQISPHFFFNSLNSLSGLVREEENKKALKYINQISNLFRHILGSNCQELVMLKEEINFLEAYKYLLSIKYEDKLTFDLQISSSIREKMMLPALSIQPIVENIIKHNIISHENPMQINVYLDKDNFLIIENNYQPVGEETNGAGIGLSNLQKRYKHLVNKEISYYIRNKRFIVALPLIEDKK